MTASLVQSKSNGATTGSTLTVTFTSAVTAGNAVVVGIGGSQGTASPTVSGVTLGSTALTKANNLGGGSAQDVEFWILAGAPSGQTVVTVTFTGGSGSSISLQAWAMEWSGMATSGLLDTAPAGGSGTSTTFSSNSTGTLTNANEVVFGAAVVATLTGTVTAPGSPWTELATLGAGTTLKFVVGYQVVSAVTAQTYSGTISASSPWRSVIMSLNQAGGNVSVALPVTQGTVAAPAPGPAAGPLALSVARVTVNAYPPVPGQVVALPVAQVTAAALPPRLPVILPAAQVTIAARPPQPSVNVFVPLAAARVTVTARPPKPSRQLLISLAARAGTDDYGTAFPQGLKATAGVIEGPVIIGSNAFYYTGGTPAPGALTASVAAAAGTDTAGNAYLAGSSTYGGTAPHLFATSLTAGSVQFWTATAAAGPWSFYGEIEITPSTPGLLLLNFSSISGAINTPQASGAGAVLPLSLPAPSTYSQVYMGDAAAAVNDIWNALIAAGILSS